MANNETLGASFSIDVTNLKAGLTQANRLIKESQSEFQAAAAGMDDWTASEDGLNAKIKSLNQITDIQRKKVDALQGEYDRLIANGLDPASKEAVELRTKINNETAALNKNEAELKQQVAALEELENGSKDAGDATDEMGDKFGGLKAAGGIAAGAIAAVGAACVAAVGAFLGLAESTREARNNMAKLETGFTEAGLTAQDAENTFTELYSVLGDDGQATEAAAFLSKIADNEQELSEMTHSLTGVYATFGSSLPLESLSEAINHSSALGSVQGSLADAIEWSGGNVDEFNAQLEACADEEERQALIMSFLSDTYDSAADTYKEVNAEVIASQKAQADLNAALNELGAIAEPIMTTLKTLAADLLTTLNPFIQLMGEGLAGALNGTAGAADSLAQGLSGIITSLVEKIVAALPSVISTIVSVVSTVIPSILQTIAEQLPNIVNTIVKFLPTLITTILNMLPLLLETIINLVIQVINALSNMLPQIITAIMAILPQLINQLIAAIPQLLQAAIQLLMAIVNALPTIITNLIAALPSIIQTIIDALLTAIPMLIEAAIQLFNAIIEAIPVIIQAIIEVLPTIINTIIDGLLDAIPMLLKGAIQLLMAIIQAIPTIITVLVKDIPNIVTTIINALLSRLPDLIMGAVQLFMGIVKAIPQIIKELVKQLPTIITTIVQSLGDGLGKIKEVGKNLIKGLWEGISDMVGWIGKKIKGFGESVLGGLKSFFGIKSPSRVMADVVGKNLALGIGEGFEKNIAGVNKDITDAMNFDDPTVNVNANRGGISGGGVTVYQTNNYKQAYESPIEKYKSKQQLFAAARLMKAGAF